MQIGILTTAQKNDAGTARYGGYCHEILAHAGFPFVQVAAGDLAQSLPSVSILLLPAQTTLNIEQQQQIADFVRTGNVLIACGGTSGLEEVLGCREKGNLSEGWVLATPHTHPVTNPVSVPLHAFGGCLVEPQDNTKVLASWLDGDRYSADNGWAHAAIGPAITLNQYGRGAALLIAADLVYSVVRIQQGYAVHADGRPAADGSAPVNDGILKTDDGLALDYERDRLPIANTRFFGHGIADEWRELLLRALLWGADLTQTPLPVLWYWPEHLQSVGLISHDSDGNDPALADILLTNMQKLQIPSTWCIQYPGGYAPAFYKRLAKAGYEIALHYDAFTQRGRAFWHEDDFRLQLDWLKDASGVRVVSNKNHYLRWEGLVEYFLWLERAGIRADQCKGPSKTGNTGFPFGGSHPWFPIEEHTLRMIDVLEINLATQDHALTCPPEVGPAVVDWAVEHYGVAHFLFHPAHAAKPDVAAAMFNVVEYGRRRGLEWWTCARIQEWERARRQVQLTCEKGENGPIWSLSSNAALAGATLLWFGPNAQGLPGAREQRQVSVYGFSASAQVVDVEAGQKCGFAALPS